VLILEDGCPLLRAPHQDLPVLRKLRRGRLLQLIEGSDHWLRVRDSEGEGWVSRQTARIQDS
jgi:SH3-like domain-containing protein